MIRGLRDALRLLVRGSDDLAALKASLQKIDQRLEAGRQETQGLGKEMRALARQAAQLERSLGGLKAAGERREASQAKVLEDLRREAKASRSALASSGEAWRLQAELRDELTAIANSRAPVIVGPWLSEVGFEVLYWIPFLRWLVQEFGIDPSRLTVLTRGGAACWYQGLAGDSVEIHELATIEQLQAENHDRWKRSGGSQKQAAISDFEQGLIDRVRDRKQVADLHVLHPLLMYELFRPVWRGVGLRTLDLWDKHCVYAPVAPPPLGPALAEALPETFVAVRFYDRPTFRRDPANQRFVAELVESLTERTAVVALDPGFSADDHGEFEIPDLPRVTRIPRLVTPENNLLVQSQVIARSKAFIGTYGGLAYVPALYGVPSLSFFAGDAKFPSIHLDVAHRAMLKLRSQFTVMSADSAATLKGLL